MLSIKEASKLIDVTKKTLREWEKFGKIKSTRTPGGHRRYLVSEILGAKNLFVFYLPKYSPHLNLAETFWRKANTNGWSLRIIFQLRNSKKK